MQRLVRRSFFAVLLGQAIRQPPQQSTPDQFVARKSRAKALQGPRRYDLMTMALSPSSNTLAQLPTCFHQVVTDSPLSPVLPSKEGGFIIPLLKGLQLLPSRLS